jgi:hypothetical protein
MTCPICFDDMDMIEYRDDAPGTDTCFKLECGHAFHTKCIVQFLTRTDHKCPSCNKHKTPEQKLEMEGILRKLLLEVRKDDRVRIARNEHEEAKREYKTVMKQLDAESKEWIHKRAAELKIAEHKLYYHRSITSVIHAAEEAAKEKGPKFMAAIKSEKTTDNNRRYGVNIAKTILFGKNYPGFRDWRLRYPRVWVRL